jgi:hypothetical protein
VNPADRNNTAIGIAAELGHVECLVALLKDPRVDPSADSNYAIKFSAQNGHLNVVVELLKVKILIKFF